MILADLIDKPTEQLSDEELENLIVTLRSMHITEADDLTTIRQKPVRQKVSNETKRATSLINKLTPQQRADLAKILKEV